MTAATELKRTPLFETHIAAKARMVDFGGWNMPVQYSGIIEEHNSVRTAVGLFDVSHMGEIEIHGPDAQQLTDFVSSNNASKLKIGQAHYSGLLNDRGGFVDDILVHKVSDTHYFLCVNASNQDGDFHHIAAHNHLDAVVEFASDRFAQIAVQGPKAASTLQKLTETDLSSIRYYWFVDGFVNGIPARIAHTGYTGEDGFEIYIAPAAATSTWQALLAAGAEYGIKPCGLGARNTLRLEAKMALYGHEITADINPFEADLAWIVKMEKGDFIGRPALAEAQHAGVQRKLIGFEMQERGIARDGYPVLLDGKEAGWVTSGGPSPTLNKNIGLCYLPVEAAVPDTPIQILIRNAPVQAVTVPTPFYNRQRTKVQHT
ncbi:MAG TPA: glycine cleavage system aminomethyltransferase GcvT [Bryobacteraceae bacterium]|jgi:aminomethyltransferase|nr:glycine cleavage system aminomethyltransferase GcvT [Bryobacteraceae bacterium]